MIRTFYLFTCYQNFADLDCLVVIYQVLYKDRPMMGLVDHSGQ